MTMFSLCLLSNPGNDALAVVDALSSQTFADWEAILCLDGAGNQSQVLAERSQADPRIKLIAADQSLSFYGNLNRCLTTARGELIKILHPNELLSTQALAELVETFEKKSASQVVTYGSNVFSTLDQQGGHSLVDTLSMLPPGLSDHCLQGLKDFFPLNGEPRSIYLCAFRRPTVLPQFDLKLNLLAEHCFLFSLFQPEPETVHCNKTLSEIAVPEPKLDISAEVQYLSLIGELVLFHARLAKEDSLHYSSLIIRLKKLRDALEDECFTKFSIPLLELLARERLPIRDLPPATLKQIGFALTAAACDRILQIEQTQIDCYYRSIKLKELREHKKYLEREVNALLGSRSWRALEPLRSAKKKAYGLAAFLKKQTPSGPKNNGNGSTANGVTSRSPTIAD